MIFSGSRKNRAGFHRPGAASVEFALCAPVFFAMVFAGIEFSRANMLMHTVESAALQGARRGIVPGATAQQCKDEAERVLGIARIRTYAVSVSPTPFTDQTMTVAVTVDVPIDANGYIAPKYFLGKTLSRTRSLSWT